MSTLKQQVISDLHKVFMLELESGDMDLKQATMNAMLEHHNITFNEAKDIDPEIFIMDIEDIEGSFYECINSIACNSLLYFTSRCNEFLNFDSVVKIENDRACARGIQAGK